MRRGAWLLAAGLPHRRSLAPPPALPQLFGILVQPPRIHSCTGKSPAHKLSMAEQPAEQPPTQPLQPAPTARRKRALLVCAEDTPQAAAACEWALKNIYQEGDVVHLT